MASPRPGQNGADRSPRPARLVVLDQRTPPRRQVRVDSERTPPRTALLGAAPGRLSPCGRRAWAASGADDLAGCSSLGSTCKRPAKVSARSGSTLQVTVSAVASPELPSKRPQSSREPSGRSFTSLFDRALRRNQDWLAHGERRA